MRLKLLTGAALSLIAAALPAQVVTGTVVSDSAAVPLAGVLVTLLNAKGDTVERSIRTDDDGRFILRSKDPGKYTLKARRLAFEPVYTTAFDLSVRSIITVRLVMTAQTILLSPEVVVGSRIMGGADMMSSEGFEWRRRRYTGVFTDTSHMRKAGFPAFTTFLETAVPGLYMTAGLAGAEEIRMNAAGGACVPDLYRDGAIQGSLQIHLLNMTSSTDFYGIEIYRRPNIPIEFRRTGFDCGVVAVWTKWHSRTKNGVGAGTGVDIRNQ